jgi:DNA-binding PadR family transcriptional regulator
MPKPKENLPSENEHLGLKGFLSFLILHELKLGQLCGDELSKKIGKRKGTALTPGTIYPTLKRLRRAKLISFRRQGRKKMYTLTESGQKEIDRLYFLFGNYFYGLKDKLPRAPLDKPAHARHAAEKQTAKV